MERKLSHNELAQAVGGSYQEMMELKAAIFANPNLKPIWDKYMAKTGDDLDATAWTVSEALNLGFTASYGACPNIYDYDITHGEVLWHLNNYPNW